MRNLIVVIIILNAFGCADIKQNHLVGNWQGTELLENGRPLEADIQVVRFYFAENNQYQYHGTLNYQEAGTYHLNANYLYTTDTLNQATTEKAVEIVHLTPDSLVIKMNDSGKERIMKLAKVN
ncbi:MAG: lipocalin family protein [Saprospiraceae bacterium]